MGQTHQRSRVSSVVALVLAGLLAWPAAATAQLGGVQLPPLPVGGTSTSTSTIVGNAKAVQATVLGMTTVLADTGTLGSTTDAREASQAISSFGDSLHAVTIGWPDQVISEASIGSLGMTIAGIGISADFVMARAMDVSGAAGSGRSAIDNLSINGLPIYVTGAPNQTVWFAGGQAVINEQVISPTSTTVNALHIIIYGVADVVVASARAGI